MNKNLEQGYRSPMGDEELLKWVGQLEHIALDMDGTIYMGSDLFECTLPFLALLREKGIGYSFLTNNPTKSAEDYIARLASMGVECAPNQIYTTAMGAIDYLRTERPELRRLFILGTESMTREFVAAGFEPTADSAEDEPDAVLVAFDTTLTYDRLCRAAWWIAQGKPYIATNPDRVCPTNLPTVLVDCGSLCAALATATGREPDLTIGKPNPDILRGVAARCGVAVERVAMVGDRLYTDVQTAHNARAMGVLTLSGETTLADADRAEQQPHLTINSLADLGVLIERAKE